MKGVAGQQHQVEASVKPGRSGVIEHPGYARAAAPLFRQGEHRHGRIDANNEPIRFPGQRRQHAGAAAKIEYCAAPLRQSTAKVEILVPAILNVVKSNHIRIVVTGTGVLVGTSGRAHPPSHNRKQHWPKSASHFPRGRAASWATYKSSKMTARRSQPALSS